jgi:alpha,alpha-trehalase
MTASALEHVEEIARSGDRLAVFLDYDGTLTPIVNRPEDANLADSMRQVVRALAGYVPVAILSGRDLIDVRRRVEVDGIVYAGSHGFDIAGPSGLRRELGAEYLPELDRAEKELHEALEKVPGAQLERKRFSIAVHYRSVNENDVPEVTRVVETVAARHRSLRRMNGKKVYELLPSIEWDKGKAMMWLSDTLGLDRNSVRPIYIGDDTTDEDAFRALEDDGMGILVGEQSQVTAARYSLKNPAEVERFLQEITDSLHTTQL